MPLKRIIILQCYRISVRLGEHDTSVERDCRFKKGAHVCAPPIQDITPDQVFLHEEFSNKNNFPNDIALIKLSRDAEILGT